MSGVITEIEARVLLEDNKDFERIIAMMHSDGNKVSVENRFFIDYSTFKEGIGERKTDVRVRVTNGHVEIVVKKGTFGALSRAESRVFVEEDDLASALSVMSMLGYDKGIAGIRRIHRAMVGEFEFAVQEVINYEDQKTVASRFLEIELSYEESARATGEAKIEELVKKLGLTRFSKDELYRYVEKLNETANGVFEYSKEAAKQVSNLGYL
jgi:adenylate cyclase class IV